MRTFLNVPLFDINRTYQMFEHHSFVLLYPLMTMYSYSEQVEDAVQVLEMNDFYELLALNTMLLVLEMILILK